MVSFAEHYTFHFLSGELPRARPDHKRPVVQIKRLALRKMIEKITQVGIYLIDGKRVAIKIQALINNGKLEVFFLSDLNQLFQALIELLRALPTDNKTFDPGGFGPFHMLAHDLNVAAGIASQ